MESLSERPEAEIERCLFGLGTRLIELYQRIEKDNHDAWVSLRRVCHQFDQLARYIDPPLCMNLSTELPFPKSKHRCSVDTCMG